MKNIAEPVGRGYARCVRGIKSGFVGGTVGRIAFGTLKWTFKAAAMTTIGNCVRDWNNWKFS
jgi:hypothetical protein